jgi:urease accessory protein
MPVLLTTQLVGADSLQENHHSSLILTDRLPLTAEERSRSRQPFVTESGREVYIQLKRGTNLRQGDRLQAADGSLVVEILAKPERVMVVTTPHFLDLLEATYHLGNRHVPLEITETHLYFLPDSVLRDLLQQRGLTVTEADRPFQPQAGAYESTPHHHHH